MAEYTGNEAAGRRIRELIDARQYVLDSHWATPSPPRTAQNAFLERHSRDEYAGWHLGLTAGGRLVGQAGPSGARPP